ncbi:ATP-binding cassette sub- G member 1 [Phlyctochytrium planicorne]|nr:ATP-binding cassette sub- G member 1 [Phlyctochytrium planicorne]
MAVKLSNPSIQIHPEPDEIQLVEYDSKRDRHQTTTTAGTNSSFTTAQQTPLGDRKSMTGLKAGGLDGMRKDAEKENAFDSSNSCEIVYKNLSFSIETVVTENKKKVKKEKSILKNVSGFFRPGRITAIMGASGAGKTSFLNVIAGEAKLGSVSGDILVNGQPVTGKGIKQISGFIFQDDVILATMTVREAITMSATLRLPDSISQDEKNKRVDNIIRDLNLTKCADTIIGDAAIKGVSGGERKRCSIAMEMVTDPKVLFLDEPTSGLDTFTAFSVIHTLRDLCHRKGQTYVATIHQPSSQLFRLFDDLLLLADGRVMYHGPTAGAIPYFAQHHFSCPKVSNPADFFFYHILNNQDGVAMPSADKSSTENVAFIDETNTERIARMLDVWEQSSENKDVLKKVQNPATGGVPGRTTKFMAKLSVQMKYLFNRESKYAFRDPLVLRSRFIQTLFLSLIVGLLYLNNTSLVQNAMGVLFFVAVVNVMLSCQAHLSSFSKQKAVFSREYSAGYYCLFSFFVTKVSVELPLQIIFPFLQITIIYWMVGMEANAWKFLSLCGIAILASLSGFALGVCLACAFSSLKIALTSSTMILLPLMLFGGLFVNNASIPVWIRWLKYISPIKYSFEGALRSQVSGTRAGDALIKNLFGDADLTVTSCCLLLLAIIAVLFIMAYLNLVNLVNKSSKTAAKKA